MPAKRQLVAALVIACAAGSLFAGEFSAARGPGGLELRFADETPFRVTGADVTNAREVRVPGSPTVLMLWEERDGSSATPYYAISLDGRGVDAVRPTAYTVHLRHEAFDPLAGEPTPDGDLAADAACELYIVQFVTQPLEIFGRQIEALGGRVRHFLAQHCYIVEMNADVRTAVAALPYVRWVGAYHPAYRLDESLRMPAPAGSKERLPQQMYNIQVHESDLGYKSAVAAKIEQLGGHVHRYNAGKYLVRAVLTDEQLYALARCNEVLFIDPWGPYETDMNNARIQGGANYVESVAGFTGQGVRGEVYDAGFNMTHVDFASRPLIIHGSAGTDSHGASTSGIVFGDGTGDPNARGMLPDGQGIVSNYSGTLGEPSRYQHTGELVQPPYLGVFQTSSVGSPRTVNYTTISADTDASLFDFDVLHCQSQSNAGDQMSRPEAWAKNILSGGALNHYDNANPADDCWCGGASIGPATDGRIKPDLAAYYDAIRTVTTGSNTAYTSSFGGTSGATPIICGHVGLFFQMWASGIFGNEVDPGGSVFSNRCHMTTAKAAVINSATQYSFSGLTHDRTRTHQGWGFPNVAYLLDMQDKIGFIDESEVLSNLGSFELVAFVEPGEPELRVTMTYADPPGNPASSIHRINDLSLRVTSPTGTVYWGNWGLREGNYSLAGGSENHVDTVECVLIANPPPGVWLVEVLATEIVQDGHVETTELDADFALVVSGAFVSNCTSAGRAQLSAAKYACESEVLMRVVDCDLNTDDNAIETVSVTIESTSEPAGESVVLVETAPATAEFRAAINTSGTNAPGVLLVQHGDTITLRYNDEDNGQGQQVEVIATATVDCAPPVISNVQVIDVGAFDASITFATNEPTLGSIRYGTSCGSLGNTASDVGYSTSHSVHLTGLQDGRTYYFVVDASDEAGNAATADNGGSCFTFQTPEIPKYYTEQFGSFDLQNRSITFTPNGSSDFYGACIEEITAFPTDPAGGIPLALSDDSYQAVTPGQPVWIYGTSFNTFYVGSNGFITFTAGDTDYTESIAEHFAARRLSVVWDDLNPATGGSVSWKALPDRVAVTWLNVPEYPSTGANSFQCEQHYDGRIVFSYLNLTLVDGLVGLSGGGGTPPDFVQMDLSALGGCTMPGDMDCDGDVDFDDIDPFVLAIEGQAAYEAAYPDCEWLNGDIDGDGDVDFDDIDPFVALLG